MQTFDDSYDDPYYDLNYLSGNDCVSIRYTTYGSYLFANWITRVNTPNVPIHTVYTRVSLSSIYVGDYSANEEPIQHENYIPSVELARRAQHVTQFFPPDHKITDVLVLMSDKLYTEEQYRYYVNTNFKQCYNIGEPMENVLNNQILDTNLAEVVRTYDSTITYNDITKGLLVSAPRLLSEPSKLFTQMKKRLPDLERLGNEPLLRVLPVLGMLEEFSRTYPNDFMLDSQSYEIYRSILETPFVMVYQAITSNSDVFNSLLRSFLSSQPYDLSLVFDFARNQV